MLLLGWRGLMLMSLRLLLRMMRWHELQMRGLMMCLVRGAPCSHARSASAVWRLVVRLVDVVAPGHLMARPSDRPGVRMSSKRGESLRVTPLCLKLQCGVYLGMFQCLPKGVWW